MLADPALQPAAIEAAYAALPAVFRDSPQYVHEGLSARAGRPIVVKVETTNPIRSFKGRGTWIAIHGLAADLRIGPDRAIVCASAGNFGQGVAYAARSLGIPAVVFCSTAANRGKVARMRALGATVIEAGDDFDGARAACAEYVASHPSELLVDGDDVRISSGAGTMGLELTEAVTRGDLPAPSVVSIPVGNGALLNGIGAWLRSAAPSCRVLGVQAELADAMVRSWQAGRPIDTESAATYADGIAARVAIPRAVELMAGRVDEMVTVSEAALHDAQALLTEELGITVEGAAAAAWAGLVAAGETPSSTADAGAAVLIITGSNV